MAAVEGLNEREALILQAVVQCYITTAEPVGSRTIVKRFGMDLSPATVRNVMSDLEEAGYLQQLHTSSGRVPTDRGYRYFVDYLMRVQELTLAERARIERELYLRQSDADEVLRQTSQLLALLTHQTGVVKCPDGGAAEVRHIEVVGISASRAAILIADNFGRVQTVMTSVDGPTQADELLKLSNFLNRNLRGVTLDKAPYSLRDIIVTKADEERRLAERALQLLQQVAGHRQGQLYLEGTASLFEQPEFRDVDKARRVFGVLEERERLVEVLRSNFMDRHREMPSVVIGSETREPELQEISVVAAPYNVGDKRVGVLGVLGPRRMPYPKLSAIVEYTASMLGRLLTSLAG
jgi:heat-inducible transcriptional repressor